MTNNDALFQPFSLMKIESGIIAWVPLD